MASIPFDALQPAAPCVQSWRGCRNRRCRRLPQERDCRNSSQLGCLAFRDLGRRPRYAGCVRWNELAANTACRPSIPSDVQDVEPGCADRPWRSAPPAARLGNPAASAAACGIPAGTRGPRRRRNAPRPLRSTPLPDATAAPACPASSAAPARHTAGRACRPTGRGRRGRLRPVRPRNARHRPKRRVAARRRPGRPSVRSAVIPPPPRHGAPAPAPGSRRSCRRRSASAPAHRRRPQPARRLRLAGRENLGTRKPGAARQEGCPDLVFRRFFACGDEHSRMGRASRSADFAKRDSAAGHHSRRPAGSRAHTAD